MAAGDNMEKMARLFQSVCQRLEDDKQFIKPRNRNRCVSESGGIYPFAIQSTTGEAIAKEFLTKVVCGKNSKPLAWLTQTAKQDDVDSSILDLVEESACDSFGPVNIDATKTQDTIEKLKRELSEEQENIAMLRKEFDTQRFELELENRKLQKNLECVFHSFDRCGAARAQTNERLVAATEGWATCQASLQLAERNIEELTLELRAREATAKQSVSTIAHLRSELDALKHQIGRPDHPQPGSLLSDLALAKAAAKAAERASEYESVRRAAAERRAAEASQLAAQRLVEADELTRARRQEQSELARLRRHNREQEQDIAGLQQDLRLALERANRSEAEAEAEAGAWAQRADAEAGRKQLEVDCQQERADRLEAEVGELKEALNWTRQHAFERALEEAQEQMLGLDLRGGAGVVEGRDGSNAPDGEGGGGDCAAAAAVAGNVGVPSGQVDAGAGPGCGGGEGGGGVVEMGSGPGKAQGGEKDQLPEEDGDEDHESRGVGPKSGSRKEGSMRVQPTASMLGEVQGGLNSPYGGDRAGGLGRRLRYD